MEFFLYFQYAMIILIIYFVQQYKHSQSNIVSEARKEELLKKSIRNGLVNISGYLCNEIDVCCSSNSIIERYFRLHIKML